jgi:hypothetical protein
MDRELHASGSTVLICFAGQGRRSPPEGLMLVWQTLEAPRVHDRNHAQLVYSALHDAYWAPEPDIHVTF